MADQVYILPPNYTQIPNVVLDLMAEMSDAELRVVLAITRQTFGWHKKRDKISLSQLMKLTGMSRQGVINGLEAGIKRELIERRPDDQDKRGGIWYRLLVNEVDQSSMLTSQLVDQSTSLTRTSQRGRPELVNEVDTQKKEKEKKERGGGSPALTPAVQAYFDTYSTVSLKPDAVEAINSTVTDLARWRQVLKDWSLSDWKATNVRGMLDRYTSGRTAKDERPGGANGKRPPDERPSLPVYQAPKDRPAAEQSRKSLAEKAKDITL